MLGDRLPENLGVGQDAGGVGMQSGEKRVAARAAERKRAVRAVKPHAAGCKPVEVRRLGERIAVAAEHRVEIVGHDQEHVLRPGVFGGGRVDPDKGQRGHEEEGRGRRHHAVSP